MRITDLLTRCTQCGETVLISNAAMQHERLVICPRCGTPAYLWQIIGRAQREPAPDVNELQGTWEGARA